MVIMSAWLLYRIKIVLATILTAGQLATNSIVIFSQGSVSMEKLYSAVYTSEEPFWHTRPEH